MTIINLGPAVTKQAISDAGTQMIGTLDLFKERERALVAILALAEDPDLVALGFGAAEITFLRTGLGALDAMVTQGLSNATIKQFTDRLRNFGL